MKFRILKYKDKFIPQRQNFFRVWLNLYKGSFNTLDEANEAIHAWYQEKADFDDWSTPRKVKEFEL